MSKSSKAKKRIIKMIRAENALLGEDNLMIDEYCHSRADFDKYCEKKIAFYKGLKTNKQILKYYRTSILPQAHFTSFLNNEMNKLKYVVSGIDVSQDLLAEKLDEAKNIMQSMV